MVQCDPRVGRQVHYVSMGSANGVYQPVCRCGHIGAWVHDEVPDHRIGATGPAAAAVIDVVVLNPEGLFFNKDCRQDQEGKAPGTWHWPERGE